MSRTHFKAIAQVIDIARQELDAETADRIAGDLAAYFESVNMNFDKQKFMSACGFPLAIR